MRVVYVGDNRNRGNFGCRGTSTALSQLISQKHEIVGRITGRYTNFDYGDLYFKDGTPGSIYSMLGNQKYWPYIRKGLHYYHRFRKRGGQFKLSKYDFASLNFDRAIENLIRCLPANKNLTEFDLRQYDFDALVVNGEGSFIFATPPWRESVIEAMEMYWAKKMGKKVFFLNAMFSDDPHTPHNQNTIDCMQELFNSCDAICLREKQSIEYAKHYFPDADVKMFPDALFTWYDLVNDGHCVTNGKYYIPRTAECDEAYYSYDFDRPYICISGSSSIVGLCHNKMESAIEAYSNLAQRIQKELDCNVYLIDVDEGDEFLLEVGRKTHIPVISMDTPLVAAAKILANARVYISGRYHPSILASLGGTPCVFMSSNSHKTASVQELLQYIAIKEYSVLPDDDECGRIICDAKEKMKNPELRKTIKKRANELCNEARKIVDIIQ